MSYIARHKILSIIILGLVLGGGYYAYQKIFPAPTVTRYVLGQVTRGTLVTAVSGSGQIEATQQVNVEPQVSGTITSVNVIPDQAVTAGQVLFTLDSTDASQALQTAEFNLKNDQLSLQKLQTSETATGLGDQDNLASDQTAIQSAQNNLATDYQNSYESVAGTFLDLPSIVSEMSSLLTTGNLSDTNSSISGNSGAQGDQKIVSTNFSDGFQGYYKNMSDYQAASASSATTTISALLSETYTTTHYVDNSIKAGINLIDFLNYSTQETSSALTSDRSVLATDDSKLQSDLSSLVQDQTTITNDQQAVLNAQTALQQKQISNVEDTQSEPIDIASAQQAIIEDQATVNQDQQTLAEYSVAAPFGGTIASVPLTTGDDASTGTTLATLVAPTQIAQISLNEVDAANVTLGDPVTLTFEALPDVTLTGKVTDINIVGTVSQGVVDYTVDIALDIQNSQVKPGMSVTANIITDIASDVLQVPSQAVHTSGMASYVLMPGADTASSTFSTALGGVLLPTPPTQVPVTIGISDNADTAISSGVNEGQWIVLSTVTSSASGAAASTGRTASSASGAGGGTLQSLLGGTSATAGRATGGLGGGGGFGGGAR